MSLGRHCGQAHVPHLPRNPILRIGPWENTAQEGRNLIHPTALGSIWEQVFRACPCFCNYIPPKKRGKRDYLEGTTKPGLFRMCQCISSVWSYFSAARLLSAKQLFRNSVLEKGTCKCKNKISNEWVCERAWWLRCRRCRTLRGNKVRPGLGRASAWGDGRQSRRECGQLFFHISSIGSGVLASGKTP